MYTKGLVAAPPTSLSHMKKATWTLVQTSKEYVNGKWSKVAIYQNARGATKIKIVK